MNASSLMIRTDDPLSGDTVADTYHIDTDSAEHAAHLARRTALAEGVHATPVRPVLHGDNGATLKATTVLAMLHWLGIKPSYSRPRVSDDNAFAEALFRTAKYRPEFPLKGFVDLDDARQWAPPPRTIPRISRSSWQIDMCLAPIIASRKNP
jgi:transposase InsO family protein